MIYIFNVIPIKVSACFLVEIDKLVLKDICKSKWTRASLVAQRLKHLPALLETWVQSLGWEDSLEKQRATHSSILVWRIPWREEPGRLQSMGSQRVGQEWVTSLSLSMVKLLKLNCVYVYIQVSQGCILSPCLYNLYSRYIMQNARLDEGQGGFKISWRNI